MYKFWLIFLFKNVKNYKKVGIMTKILYKNINKNKIVYFLSIKWSKVFKFYN